jgi:acetolactate synthase-1/2/3 large subunit
MAARYGSVSGKLGVCLGAGGVGVNNMINGIADAMRAKSPVLVITGYIHRWQIGKGAIQELDTKDILKPITKYSETILDEKNVMQELKKAMQIALTSPQGPVHISIPIDVQLSEFNGFLPDKIEYISNNVIQYNDINKAIEIINEEDDGIIMVGKGGRGYSQQIMELSEHLQWPIITTPEGKGVIYSDYPLNLGNYGFAGTDAATEYVASGPAKCILILGSSLGEASTYNFSKTLINGKKVIHVDLDAKELGKVYETDVKIHSDMKFVIPQLIKNTRKATKKFEKPQLNKPYVENHTGISTRVLLENLPNL